MVNGSAIPALAASLDAMNCTDNTLSGLGSWFSNIINNNKTLGKIGTIALAFIPVVGPAASIAVGLTLQHQYAKRAKQEYNQALSDAGYGPLVPGSGEVDSPTKTGTFNAPGGKPVAAATTAPAVVDLPERATGAPRPAGPAYSFNFAQFHSLRYVRASA